MPESVATVFVSYSHSDKNFVDAVVAGLIAQRFYVWLDERELKAGDSLLNSIAKALDQVDFVVAFVSPASQQSDWCAKELSIAMTGEVSRGVVAVIPVRIDNALMPPSLSDKVYVDATGLKADEVALHLAGDMQRHMTPIDLPARRHVAQRGAPQEVISAVNGPVAMDVDFDRNYELLESGFFFSPSPVDRSVWDMHLVTRRRMRCDTDEGIRLVPIDFVRDSDRMLPFEAEKLPTLRLVSSVRTGEGMCRLALARKVSASSFVQDVEFDPPVSKDEVVDFTVDCLLPSYKYAFADDILLATRSSPMGPRNYEFVARAVNAPTDLLVMSVFLPDSLAATPAGPKVRRASRVDAVETAGIVSRGEYSEQTGVVEGQRGVLMRMAIPKPRLNRRYRLAWNLPARPE